MFDDNYKELFTWFDSNLEALVAVGIGGNSTLAKRLRVKAQWRDRYGRWVKMGIGVKFKVRLPDGRVVSVIGKFVGASSRKGWGWIRVVDDPNVPNGYIEVESANAQEILASLDSDYLKSVGVEAGKDVDGNVVGARDNAIIPNLSDLNRIDLETSTMEPPAVPGWKAMSPGRLAAHKSKLVEDARKDFFDAREKARLENPSPSADEVDISEYVTSFSADVDEFFDSRFVYESESGGLSQIIVSPTSIQDFPGKLEETAEMLTNLERDYPVPGGVAVHITPFVQEMGDEAQKFGMISGGTAYSGGFRPEMEDNPYAIRIQTSNFERRLPEGYTKEDRAIDRLTNLVPAHFYQKGNSSRSVLAHEYGHVRDFATPREDYPEFGGGMSEKVEKLVAEDPSVLDALGTYGRSNPVETVAETFAQMALDRYDGLGRAQIDARLFDIVEQPVERAQLRGVRANRDWSRVAEASPKFAQKYDQRGSHLAGPALDDARVDKHIAFLRSTGYDLDSAYEANFPAGPSGGRKKKTSAQLADEIVKLEEQQQDLKPDDEDFNKKDADLQQKIDVAREQYRVTKEQEDAAVDEAGTPVPDEPTDESGAVVEDVLKDPDEGPKLKTSAKNLTMTKEQSDAWNAEAQAKYGKYTDPAFLQSEYGLSETTAKDRATKVSRALDSSGKSETNAEESVHKALKPVVDGLVKSSEGLKAKALYSQIQGIHEAFDKKYGKVPDVPAPVKPVVEEVTTEVEDIDSLDALEAQEIQKRLGQGAEGLQGVLFGVKGVAAKDGNPARPGIPVSRERIAERLGMDPKDISDEDLKQVKKLLNSDSFKAYRDRIARANYKTTNDKYQPLSPQELSDLFADMETDLFALDNDNLGDQLQGQLLDITAKYKLPPPTPKDQIKTVTPAIPKVGDDVRTLDDFKNLPAGSSIIVNAEDGTSSRYTRSDSSDPNSLISKVEVKSEDGTWQVAEKTYSDNELTNQFTFRNTTVERVGPAAPDTSLPEGYENVGPISTNKIKAGDIVNGKKVSSIVMKERTNADGVDFFDVTYEDGTTEVLDNFNDIKDVFRSKETATESISARGTLDTSRLSPARQAAANRALDQMRTLGSVGTKYGIEDATLRDLIESRGVSKTYSEGNNKRYIEIATGDPENPTVLLQVNKEVYDSFTSAPGTELKSVREINELPDGTQIIGTSKDGTTYTLTKEEGGRWTEGQAEVTNEDFQAFLDEGDTLVIAGEGEKTPSVPATPATPVTPTTDTTTETTAPVLEAGTPLNSVDEIDALPDGSFVSGQTSAGTAYTIEKRDGQWFDTAGSEEDGGARRSYTKSDLQFFIDQGDLFTFESSPKPSTEDTTTDTDTTTSGINTKPAELAALIKDLNDFFAEDDSESIKDLRNAASSLSESLVDAQQKLDNGETLDEETISTIENKFNQYNQFIEEELAFGFDSMESSSQADFLELNSKIKGAWKSYQDSLSVPVASRAVDTDAATTSAPEVGSILNSVDEINSLPDGSSIVVRSEGVADLNLVKRDGQWFAPLSDQPDTAYTNEELQDFIDYPDDTVTFESGPSEVVDDTPATDEVVAPEISTKDPAEMTLEEIYAEMETYSDYRKALPRGQRTPEQQAILDQMSRRETELRPQQKIFEEQAGRDQAAKAIRESLADLKVGSILPAGALANKAVAVEGFQVKDPESGEIFTYDGSGTWTGDKGTVYSDILAPMFMQGGSYEVVTIPQKSAPVSTPATESLVKAIGLEKITVRTKDSDYDDESYLPTDQQRNVIDAIVSDIPRVKVPALAGTGKTTTLVRAARMKQKYSPDQFGVYIAFNKSVQTEAEGRFPNNVAARTGDSLSFNGLKEMKPDLHAKFDKQKTEKPITRQDEIADAIGVPFGQKNRGAHARRILAAISQFSISDDDEILEEHFIRAGIKEPSAEDFAAANKAWADINNPNGRLKFNFDHIMKIWALSDPDLSKSIPGIGRKADFIFMDEAQDMNPVLSGVIERQDAQVIYVGDSYQAIYGFRGGKDELNRVEADVEIPLTKTFRFGEKLAGPGNRMLSLLEAKYKIEAAGKNEGKILSPGTMKDATAVLVRTNAGRFLEMINELDRGRVVGMIEKDYKDAETLVATVKWLQTGQGNKPFPFHEDLTGYNTWKEVETDILKENADAKVEMIGRLFEKFGTEELEALLKKVVVIKNDSGKPAPDQKIDVLVMTAHKSKGLEFDKVRIGNDFRGPKLQEDGSFIYPDPEELRLGYVALTRAENELDPGALSWIYQHSEEKDEDPAVPARGPVQNPDGKAPEAGPVETVETVETVDDTAEGDTVDTVDGDTADDTVDNSRVRITSSARLEDYPDGSVVRFYSDEAEDGSQDRDYKKIDGRWIEVDPEDREPLDPEDAGLTSETFLDMEGGELFEEYDPRKSEAGTDEDEDEDSDPEDEARAELFKEIQTEFNAARELEKRYYAALISAGRIPEDYNQLVEFHDPRDGETYTITFAEAKDGMDDASSDLQNSINRRRDELGELTAAEEPFYINKLSGLRRELLELSNAIERLRTSRKGDSITAQYVDENGRQQSGTLDELTQKLEQTQRELATYQAFFNGTNRVDEYQEIIQEPVNLPETEGSEGGTPGTPGGSDGGGGGGRQPDGGGGPAGDEEEEVPWYEREEYQADPTLPRLTRDDWNSDLYKTPEVIRAQELQARYNRTRQRYQALIRQAENSKNMSDRDKMSLAWQIKVAEGESIIAEKKLKKYIANMSQADLAAYNRTRQPDEANAATLAVDEMARTTSLVQNKYDQYVRIQDELFAASRAAPGRGLSAERTMSLTAEKLRLEGELAQYTNYMLELESRLDEDDRNNWDRWAFQESIRLRQEDPETYRQRLETMQGMLPCVPEEECGDLASLYKGRRTSREDFEGSGRGRVPGQDGGDQEAYEGASY
jgi:hypothetical protein